MKPRPLYLLKLIICILLFFVVASQIYPPERNNIGNRLFDQQNYANALNAYQLAQVNAPDQWEYYYNAARVLAEAGRLRDASEALNQALSANDDSPKTEAYYNLGHIYYQLGHYNDAVVAFQEVLRHTPDDDARFNYELALTRQQPTPTPQQQQTDPEEDETNPENTPTSNPADQDELTPSVAPTATPTVTSTLSTTSTPTATPTVDTTNENQPPSGDGSTPTGGESGTLGDTEEADQNPDLDLSLTIDDVERQFDAIQDSQQTLRQALESIATPERPNEKDW